MNEQGSDFKHIYLNNEIKLYHDMSFINKLLLFLILQIL